MTAKRVVLDANILVRAVLGVRVKQLITRYGADILFFAPEAAFTDAARHLPEIAVKRDADATDLLISLDRLRAVVETVPFRIIEPFKNQALSRIGKRDATDWPYVAAALALSCPIWTEDNDFFGAGIATWTSDRIEIYLRGE